LRVDGAARDVIAGASNHATAIKPMLPNKPRAIRRVTTVSVAFGATCRLLRDFPFKCSACGLRDVSLWLFAKRAEADAWAQESGPDF
jgi:hypothetical protein